jgi:uncharacterized protein YvpB
VASDYAVGRDGWEISRSGFAAMGAEYTTGDLVHLGRLMPVFRNRGDTEPTDILSLHIVQVLIHNDSWKLVRTIRGEKWINLDWLPERTIIGGVPGFNQQSLGLPTGCEIVAFAMIANKYSETDVFALVDEMPRSYDPRLGFRGDPFTRGGFTILPQALMPMAERHLGSGLDMTGASVEDLQTKLAMGRPVLAWMRGMYGFNVHVVTLTGYDGLGFYYNDPWEGGVNNHMAYPDFMAMWEGPIQDMILNRLYPPRIAMSY